MVIIGLLCFDGVLYSSNSCMNDAPPCERGHCIKRSEVHMLNHDNEKKKMSSRREFIGKTGLGLLIGSAFLPGTGLAKSIKKPDSDRYQSLTLNTHEWFGDIEERLDIPKEWEVNIHHMKGHENPVLSKEKIRNRINSPINSKPLREIAAGKKTAVILFDDITRATPAGEVAPLVIDELNAGGIKNENILFVCTLGSHAAVTEQDVRAKLGSAIVDNFPWINHNCSNNFADLGRTTLGNRILVNYYVMKADVKISISGIKKHGGAGYSGGAKAILPGVASLDTISYNHHAIPGVRGNSNSTVGTGKIYHNDLRTDMEEAARMAGLDFTIQLLLNGKRQIIGVYAGDLVDAFRPAVHDANKRCETDIAKDADVVIVNCYPRNLQESGFGWANRSLRSGGTAVVIWQMPLGKSSIHYSSERRLYNGKSFWENQSSGNPAGNAGQVIIFSQYAQYRDVMRYQEKEVHLVRKWENALALLKKAHGDSTSVAVYPYAGSQHEPITLDSP